MNHPAKIWNRPATGTETAAESASSLARTGWLFGPWIDLLLVSNCFWPLLVFLQHDIDFTGRAAVQFWQIYFITTPHRWSTLAVVLMDRQLLRNRRRFLIGFTLLVIGIVVGVRLGTGGLTCLLAIDYLWNAWHFAAQHHGIYRIYGRLASRRTTLPIVVEKWLLRAFLLYVILRVAQVSIRPSLALDLLNWMDWFMPLLPAIVLGNALLSFRRAGLGGLIYLVSVVGLFLALLTSVHVGNPALVLCLTTASAWFHASEYLTVIGWRLKRQAQTSGPDTNSDIVRWLLSRWAVSLLVFMLILGSVGWMAEHNFLELWLLINVIAAFLHYGFDGVMWKRSSPSISTTPVGLE